MDASMVELYGCIPELKEKFFQSPIYNFAFQVKLYCIFCFFINISVNQLKIIRMEDQQKFFTYGGEH